MSIKQRRRKRKAIRRPGTWKLIDDKSGFEILSTEAVIDWRGVITSQDLYDPMHYIYQPIPLPQPEIPALPFTRIGDSQSSDGEPNG